MSLWKKKQLTELDKELNFEGHTLFKSLNAKHLVAIGIGAIIGAGIFSITGIAAANHAGPAILISFIIAAIGCAFCALCYSELSAMAPNPGSAYSYTYATMGQLLAWFVGWNLILEYAIGAATVSVSASAYIVSILHSMDIYLPHEIIASPWQSVPLPDGSHVFGLFNLPAALIDIIISILLVLGIKSSVKFNYLIMCIKISIILLFIALGAWYINIDNFTPFIPKNHGVWGEYGWSGILRASGIVFFAYIGFDAVSTAAKEAIEPEKNLPIGIIGSLIISTLLYISFTTVLIGLVPYHELNVAAPVAIAIDKTPFWWLNIFIKIAIIAGCISVILVFLLGQARIFFTMAHDGLLPPVFSKIHPKFRTPWLSQLILMVLVSTLSGLAPISLLGELTSIGTLLAFVAVCASVIILRHTHPEYPRPFKVPGNPWVPLMGIFICLVMMVSLGQDTWIRLLIWSFIGFIIYFSYGLPKSKRVENG